MKIPGITLIVVLLLLMGNLLLAASVVGILGYLQDTDAFFLLIPLIAIAVVLSVLVCVPILEKRWRFLQNEWVRISYYAIFILFSIVPVFVIVGACVRDQILMGIVFAIPLATYLLYVLKGQWFKGVDATFFFTAVFVLCYQAVLLAFCLVNAQ
jgi:hypothetical protein